MCTTGINNPWVPHELRQMEKLNIPFRLHSMRKPAAHYHTSQWALDLDRQTQVLYPVKLFKAIWALCVAPFFFGTRFWGALFNAIFAKRESMRVRIAGIAHFVVACIWARQLKHQQVSLIHSQWIHSGGTIAMYGAWLLNKPFSFTGHAVDLFRERCALQDKVDRAAFIICISEFHKQIYLKMGASEDKLHIVHCGIDFLNFTPKQPSDSKTAPHIVTTGRLVEKKGFEYLIDACSLLKDMKMSFKCTIVGDGPLDKVLAQRVKDKGLQEYVSVSGKAMKHSDIPAFLHSGDVYCLPCVWSSDNDVDGLPQSLMEAMACGVPCISTDLVGIPDLVIHGKTGLLVKPNNAKQLASALKLLLQDKPLQNELIRNSVEHIKDEFDLSTCLEPLAGIFRQYLNKSENFNGDVSIKITKATV